MARKKKLPSPFEGHWAILSMSAWDEGYLHEEEPAYIEFSGGQNGQFHFGYVHGNIDYCEGTRDGVPAVEFSWDGNAEMDDVNGRGWAVLKGDELHGMLFFHQGDESDFVAKRTRRSPRRTPVATVNCELLSTIVCPVVGGCC